MNSNSSKSTQWKHFLQQNSSADFDSVLKAFNDIYTEDDIPLTWFPETYPLKANAAAWIEALKLPGYDAFYIWSEQNRAAFWSKALTILHTPFHRLYSSVLEPALHPDEVRWLPGALLNPVENCFLAAPGQTALCFKTETQDTLRFSYAQLYALVKHYAQGFTDKGIKAGERIILYLPFSTEAIACYLALIYTGAEAVLVADSFSGEELKKRMDISGAQTIITTDHYTYAGKQIDVLSKVVSAAPDTIILHPTGNVANAYAIRQRHSDLLLSELKHSNPLGQPHYYAASDTITVLFSSGTTKEPKAIPWTALTPLKCATDGLLLQDIHEGDVVTWTSGMGWMMAPWLIFATLMNKATLAVYGGAHTQRAFLDFTLETQVTVLGTIPSVVKSWRSQSFGQMEDWQVRVFSSTGEPSEKEDYLYLQYMNRFRAPVIEYCGGTEISGGYISSCVLLPNAPAWFNTPAPGGGFVLLSDAHTPVNETEAGEVFIIPPSVGLSQRLLNKDHANEYYSSTPAVKGYPVLRKHGDGFFRETYKGITFYKSAGRTDDAMNLGGIKISSVELEEVFNRHPLVLESAAVSYQEKNGGPEKLAVFIRVREADSDAAVLKTDLQKLLQQKLNPLFKISQLIVTDAIPRTASNKIVRRQLRKQLTDAL